MKLKQLNRRQLFSELGTYSIALPLLPSLWGDKACAQSSVTKRFITIHNGHCQAVEQWLPNPSLFSFKSRSDTTREINLKDIPGNISSVLGSSFDSIRDKLTLISRLDSTSGRPNHNAEFILSGGVKGDIPNTLDQIISKKLNQNASTNLFIKSVFDEYNSGASQVSLLNGNYNAGDFNPSFIFDKLFSSTLTPVTGQLDPKVKRRALVIDHLLTAFKSIESHPRLSKDDLRNVQNHKELLFQVEKKVKAKVAESSSTTSLNKCSPTTSITNSPVKSGNAADYQIVIDQMFDVLELGIKCGKIQVATLMLHVYDYFAGNVGFIPGINSQVRLHEDIGHAASAETRQMKLALNQFFAQRVSRFLKNLNTTENSANGTTYLDNSLILWANDQGSLQDTNGHTSLNVPVLLAGSAGGFIKSGRYIDYGNAYTGDSAKRAIGGNEYNTYQFGRPYNQLLITIAQAMGLSSRDYETSGQSGFGFYGDWVSRYTAAGSHQKEILPYINS